MNRREAIAKTTLLLGGTIVGSNIFLTANAKTLATFNTEILSPSDQSLLNEIGEVILPTTPGSPGAKAGKVADFMNMMVSKCYHPTEQKIFKDGIQLFKKRCLNDYKKDFLKLSSTEKNTLITTIAKEAKDYHTTRKPDEPSIHYFAMIKQLTITGYFSSQVGATTAVHYDPIPGKWVAEIPYKKGDKAWALM